jgi:hypothetical protein
MSCVMALPASSANMFHSSAVQHLVLRPLASLFPWSMWSCASMRGFAAEMRPRYEQWSRGQAARFQTKLRGLRRLRRSLHYWSQWARSSAAQDPRRRVRRRAVAIFDAVWPALVARSVFRQQVLGSCFLEWRLLWSKCAGQRNLARRRGVSLLLDRYFNEWWIEAIMVRIAMDWGDQANASLVSWRAQMTQGAMGL